MTLQDVATGLSALSDAATVAAIVIGGCWAYYLFIKNRQRYPRIGITLRADVVRSLPSSVLVEVAICLQNNGAVRVQPRVAEVRARPVVPLPEQLSPVVEEGFDPVAQGEASFQWPVLAQRRWKWSAGDFDLEPGESESVIADFFVPTTISVIQLYVFVQNPVKKSGVGWTHVELLRIGDEMAPRETSTQAGGDQRQQKPQQSQQPTQQPAPQGPSQQSGAGGNGGSGG